MRTNLRDKLLAYWEANQRPFARNYPVYTLFATDSGTGAKVYAADKRKVLAPAKEGGRQGRQ